MATLGQAYVQIMPSAKGIKSELEKLLGKDSESAGRSAGESAGKGLVSTITAVIAAAGIGKIIKDGISASLNQGAELQQNLGGTEAVFGKFAGSVQKTAQDAYRNMGLSASDYMATANKMGSLFQGSGVEQQKSLQLTADAMQRAADVASVMGIDMEMAMESVAGAAKGNFTMMDNLGVAMNATTLEAYALEKGMNFKWKTASNAEKAELAMKMFMDRTSQYAGNFARESEDTFSGSLDAMKGAWANVLGNLSLGRDLSGPLAGLAETVSNFFFKNFIPMLGNIFKGLPTVFSNLFKSAGPAIEAGLNSLFPNNSGMIKQAMSVFNSFGSAIQKVFSLVGYTISDIASALGRLFAGFANSGAINSVMSALDSIATMFLDFSEKLDFGSLLPWQEIGQYAGMIVKYIADVISAIANIATKVDSNILKGLVSGIMGAVVAFKAFNFVKGLNIPNPFKALTSAAKNSVSSIKAIFSGISGSIKSVFSGLGGMMSSVFSSIGSAVSTVFKGIASAISMLNPAGILSFSIGVAAVTAALGALGAMRGAVLPFLQGLADILVSLVGGVLSSFVEALTNLQPVFMTIAAALTSMSPLVVAIGQAFAAASPFVTALGEAVNQIVATIVVALPGIITAVAGLVTAITDGLSQMMTAITPIIEILATAITEIVTVIVGAIVQIVEILAPYIPVVTQMFTTIATVVAGAIVQIIQALAPFIPNIQAMVEAIAPVLQSVAEAFTTLLEQISPTIDSITNLVTAVGEAINDIFTGISDIVTSVGDAISGVLDSIAGVFDSIGNAAKNAGQGLKDAGAGLKTISNLNLVNLGAGVLAAGKAIGDLVKHSGALGTTGTGMKNVGTGLQQIASSGSIAASAMTRLPSLITQLNTSLSTIKTNIGMAKTAFSEFGAGAGQSATSLTIIVPKITQFLTAVTQLVTRSQMAGTSMTMFGTQATATGNAMQLLGTAVDHAVQKVSNLGTNMSQSMSQASSAVQGMSGQMSNAITNVGTQMATAMTSGMQRMTMSVTSGMAQSAIAVQAGGVQMSVAIRTISTQMATASQASMAKLKYTFQNGMQAIANVVRTVGSRIVTNWRAVGTQLQTATSSMVNQVKGGFNSLGSINLAPQGRAVLTSFRSGMQSEWTATQSWVKQIAEWIKKNKGPISYDRKLLIPHGKSIMLGLREGLVTGFEDVKSEVVDMASEISDVFDDAMNLGDSTVQITSSVLASQLGNTDTLETTTASNQSDLMSKIDDLIEEVRRSGVTYLDGKQISRSVDRRLGENTQLRSRTSWV